MILSCVSDYVQNTIQQQLGGPLLTLSALMSTTVDILSFYKHLYNHFFKVKYASNFETCIRWDLNFTNNTNFQSLEVVDRRSETQLQVAENLNFLAQCSKG